MRPSSAPVRRQGRPCSSTSRSSIIGSACTQPWAIALQLKPGPAWRRSLCARQHDILIASLHSQGGSPEGQATLDHTLNRLGLILAGEPPPGSFLRHSILLGCLGSLQNPPLHRGKPSQLLHSVDGAGVLTEPTARTTGSHWRE